jgi:multisubunit Na+/H+ antiporter MnhF subunit
MSLVLGVIVASLVGVLYRFAAGPTPWDRVLAANSASARILLIMAIVAVATEQTIYLDVAVVYAALSFIGTVVLSRSMERSGDPR